MEYGLSVGTSQWVMLVYRLPRTPSTPRITLWRKLRRLGVAQIVDGVVALPASADTREQLEWLAEDVVEAGGEATIWLSEPATAAEHRRSPEMTERIEAEYRAIAYEARAARPPRRGAAPDACAAAPASFAVSARFSTSPTDEAQTRASAVEALAKAAAEAAA